MNPPAEAPLYARLLRLQHLAPSGLLCFVFLEGSVALGVLLALAELVSWWGVLVLPLLVAGLVKLNDVVAGLLTRAVVDAPLSDSEILLRHAQTVDLRSAVMLAPEEPPTPARPWTEHLDVRQQWARQAATRRYE